MRRSRGLVTLLLVAAGLACAAPRVAAPPAQPDGDRAGPAVPASVAVVQRQLEAYNAQDLDAFVATYADDVVITSASTGQTLASGKEALRQRYGTMFQRFPRNRCRVVERRVEGDRVVLDHEIITGRSPEHPDPWDVGWVRYEVEGGLIRRVELP
ncbi:nuclear transport factor 2 family protein [Anaeromyxobacter oryzae]|uniref:SnoaL-like domain-containing protein n=1 Tax=Anaeromyxobacter oryzae TaxID=2918170 RepID=A0ABN6MMF3_9BACT|nr:nuclear transport factor 2 family protein [Anaeromyxobacter oryzae]BDG02135.1 hypothetical protein AMOR_11310 [Anaeromyxobacter oryzae]